MQLLRNKIRSRSPSTKNYSVIRQLRDFCPSVKQCFQHVNSIKNSSKRNSCHKAFRQGNPMNLYSNMLYRLVVIHAVKDQCVLEMFLSINIHPDNSITAWNDSAIDKSFGLMTTRKQHKPLYKYYLISHISTQRKDQIPTHIHARLFCIQSVNLL